MGRKGRELVKVDVDELLKELNTAYAEEWIAYYYYKWAAAVMSGVCSPNVAAELKRIADEEEEHADELADRIIELGGEPERDFEDLYKIARCRKIVFPKDTGDLKGFLTAVIEQGERCAIDGYTGIIKMLSPCYDRDLTTFHLIEHILSEEIHHEEAFENLL
ncbi:MAG: ferritin-like domain-containing protein [Candidatus Bathyarchaeota archaeon]|nr:ferritin-like domain-containing protein [Candidatus Bathyarchaeota archaeon]